MISQDKYYIEQFKQEDNRWIFTAYESETIINLNALGIEVAIADIYNKVILNQSE